MLYIERFSCDITFTKTTAILVCSIGEVGLPQYGATIVHRDPTGAKLVEMNGPTELPWLN